MTRAEYETILIEAGGTIGEVLAMLREREPVTIHRDREGIYCTGWLSGTMQERLSHALRELDRADRLFGCKSHEWAA
jgi:hypothetical protein